MNRNFHNNQVQSLLAKSAENMLLAINKHKRIIMLWHIYIWRKKRNTTKEKSNAKTRQYQRHETVTTTDTWSNEANQKIFFVYRRDN